MNCPDCGEKLCRPPHRIYESDCGFCNYIVRFRWWRKQDAIQFCITDLDINSPDRHRDSGGDFDEIHRVVDALSEDDRKELAQIIEELAISNMKINQPLSSAILLLKKDQWHEAILRAVGVWEYIEWWYKEN